MKISPLAAGDMRRKVLLIYTGGTLGMKRGPKGYVPATGYLGQVLPTLPAFQDQNEPRGITPPNRDGVRIQYTLFEYDPLLDSSNMTMRDWVHIAHDIEEHYHDYDGFVVLHGTDTMAYSGAALSFMLKHLGKSVIITGSQIPLSEVRNDAHNNLLDALHLAGYFTIPEVGLLFRGKLMRANRARKVDATGLDAFDSANYLPLAEVGIDLRLHTSRVRPMPTEPLDVSAIINHQVASCRLFPGMDGRILENYLQPPLQGLVLETFGSGNAPDNRPDLLSALREATERGIVVVQTTQCLRGSVSSYYASGAALRDAGVVGCADMTTEAALAKLAYLLSFDRSAEEVRSLMSQDLRGEMSV